MGLPAPCRKPVLQTQLRPQPENLAVTNRGLRRAQVDRYIPETDLGNLPGPDLHLLPAGVPTLHLLCPDQSASLLVDAMVCPQSQTSLLARPGRCRGWASRGEGG